MILFDMLLYIKIYSHFLTALYFTFTLLQTNDNGRGGGGGGILVTVFLSGGSYRMTVKYS